MDLVFVRHSISVSNDSGLISGAGLDTPLSEEGIEYAKQVSSHFDEKKFQAVYSSPLQRAKDTAEILVKETMPVQLDKRLVEFNFGKWEAKHPDPLIAKYPDAFDYSGMFNANYSKYAPEAESYSDVAKRVGGFVNEMKAEHKKDTVLVVCHGLTIRALMGQIFQTDVFGYAAPDNVAFSHIHFDEDEDFRPRMMTFNKKLV